MRALLIDENSKKTVEGVVEYAEQNRYSRPYMAALMNGAPAPGDDLRHCCYFFDGFKAVFTIEEQPMGWCRHLSISVAAIDKMPSIEAVKMIMREFGIVAQLEDCCVYVEDSSPKAINIISPI